MIKFLSGWAVAPQFHQLPPEVALIDTSLLIVDLMEQGRLKDDWIEIVASTVSIEDGDHIIGYSTGAIIALGLATKRTITLTLVAPCFSFIPRSNHPSGVAQRVVSHMQKALLINQEKLLSDFFRRAEIDIDTSTYGTTYTAENLCIGLDFLQQVTLIESTVRKPLSCTLFASKDDLIIPFASSEIVANYFRLPLTVLDGGHGLMKNINFQDLV